MKELTIREAVAVPPRKTKNGRVSVFDQVLRAATRSKTGIVGVDMEDVEEAKRMLNVGYSFIKTHGYRDLFKVQQRGTVVFVTDLTKVAALESGR